MVGEDNAMTPMPHLGTGIDRSDTDPTRRSGRGNGRLGHDGRAILARTVALDVIPRLVSMPWIAPPSEAPARPTPPEPIHHLLVEELVELCLEHDGHAAALFIAARQGAGIAADRLYLELLSPAARRLGEMWEQDECTFTDVTIGVMRLQNAQRALSPDLVGAPRVALEAPRILLLPVPGEQHTFGLSMVMDFFRRAGWDSWLGVVETGRQAIDLVRRERADMVGLSFGCDDRIDTAAKLIADFRGVAPNKQLKVIVGGPSFVADPLLAARIGADGTALDGHQAVMLAHDLLLHTAERN